MDYFEIKELLQKYFAAETSVEEEKILKAYFQQQKLHPDFEQYAGIFQYASEAQSQPGADFDQRMLQLIDAAEDRKPVPIRNNIPYWLKIAALFVALSTGTILLHRSWQVEKSNHGIAASVVPSKHTIEDTFSDPELARQELEKALAVLSSKLNKGQEMAAQNTSRLQVISKVMESGN